MRNGESLASSRGEKKRSAIVIGGGLAGIAAALSLVQQGVQVRLLESRRRLGGRVGSFSDPESQTLVDYCQHVGMGCCRNLLQLIEELGHSRFWDRHTQLHFFGPDGRYQRLSALPGVPAPLHIAGWLLRWPGLRFADRVSVARGVLAIRKLRPSDRSSDGVTAETWLRSQRQSEPAIQNFWRTIVVSALGEELDRVNLSAVAKVLQDGFLNSRDAFHLLVPNQPLGELFGTMAEQVLRDKGVDVQMQSRVQSLVQFDQQRFAVELDGVEYGKRSLEADAIIVAVPWFRVADLMGGCGVPSVVTVKNSAEQLAASPISGVHTWWDRPWLKTPHAAIVGRLCQWVFPKPSETAATRSNEHYYQIVISASRQLPRGDARQLEQLICEDLAFVFPEVRDARLLRLQAVTDPKSVYSLTTLAASLRPESHIAGTNLWLAGDWVQTGWPATMEGAIISGRNAARLAAGVPSDIT